MASGSMKIQSFLLIGAAAILGLPATVIYVALLPVQLMGLIATVETPSIEGLWFVLPLLCGGFSLGWYWFLIAETAKQREIKTSRSFKFGIACAPVAAIYFVSLSRLSTVPIVVVLAPFFGAYMLYRIQKTGFYITPTNDEDDSAPQSTNCS